MTTETTSTAVADAPTAPRTSRRRLLALLAMTAALGVLAGTGVRAADVRTPDYPATAEAEHLVHVPGVGETMVLVVAGAYATEAEAQQVRDEIRFGDMQGFYVDRADNYDLRGVYLQTSPSIERVLCGPDGGTGPVPCPAEEPVVARHVVDDVDLQLLDLTAARTALATAGRAPGCGTVGMAPCFADTVAPLGGDLRLPKDRWLVLSAFRTKAGAAEWIRMSRVAGVEEPLAIQVVKRGGPYVGLGQESHPLQDGPLLEALADAERFQR